MKRVQQCECGSNKVTYDQTYGFYKCQSCGDVWGYLEDDPDYDECDDDPDYGACCACNTTGPTVRNFLCLDKKAPVPGQGWGCMVCDLPLDGAVAVVCDSCLENECLPEQAIYGYPSEKKRCFIATLTEDFKHQDVPHD